MDWSCLTKLNGFSLDIASLLAHASSDAYFDMDRKSYLEGRWNCRVRLIDVNESQAMVFDGPSLVISFRGTEPKEIRDWLSDLNVLKTSWKNSLSVHSGFLDAYLSVRNKVLAECANAQGRDIFLCGHSLGGAIADLAAIDLESLGMQPRRIYTFGAPRVLSLFSARKARNVFQGRKFRVVNGNDIVPRVPICLRFQHFGTLAYINRFLSPGSEQDDVKADIEINPGLAYLLYDRILGYRADMISSHSMSNCIQGIENAKTNRVLRADF